MPDTVWALDEQTEGKHLLLRAYLDGWFAILGSFSGRLLFVDGFAGPGEYADGEMGSPLVAIESVRQHKNQGRLRSVEVVFLFIEQDEGRVDTLRSCWIVKRLCRGRARTFSLARLMTTWRAYSTNSTRNAKPSLRPS